MNRGMGPAGRIFGVLRKRRGSLALEAALLFPIAVLVLVGFSEIYFYARAVAIVERVAFSSASLIAKRATLYDCVWTNDSGYLGTHILAAETMAQPLDLKAGGMVILSAVTDPGDGDVISWQRRSSYKLDDIASTIGVQNELPVLPADLDVKTVAGVGTDTLIVAEVAYRFRPLEGLQALLKLPLGEVTVRRRAFSRARWGNIGTLGSIENCTGLTK